MLKVFVESLTKNYFNFRGRARRRDYWFFHFSIGILTAILIVAIAAMGLPVEALSALAVIIGIVFFIPSLSITVRRIHDISLSGWWALLEFIGFGFVILIFCLTPGTVGDNKYGPDPKGIRRLI